MSTRVELNQGALNDLLHGQSGPVANEILRRGIRIETLAKQLCPVGTPESTGKKGYRGGRLRASITGGAEITEKGGELAVQVGTDVYYAIYVEFGTYKMAAQPYLRPALDAAG